MTDKLNTIGWWAWQCKESNVLEYFGVVIQKLAVIKLADFACF